MELLSFTHVCRLCVAREGVFIPIFEGVGQKRAISTKIKDCLPVKVSQDDQLPKKICENCLDRLESIHNYRNATIDAERELCKLLSEVKQKNASSKINTSVAKCETVKLTTEQSRSGASTPQIKKYGSLVNGVYVKYDCDSDDSRDSATSTASIQGPEPREVVVADYQEPPDDAGTEIQLPSNSNTVAVGVKQSAAPPLPPPPLLPPPQPTPSTTVTTTPQTPLQPPPLVPSAYLLSFVPIQQLAVSCRKDDCVIEQVKENLDNATSIHNTVLCKEIEEKNTIKTEKCENAVIKESKLDEISSNGNILKSEKFKCQNCGKICISKGHLKSHSITHSNDRPFCCEICDRHYKRAYELKKHKETHTSEMKHVCDVCGYSTFQKSNLTVHKKRHKGDCRFWCELCGRGYYTDSELQRHSGSHSTDQPFQCAICNRTYTYKNNLAFHLKKHDPAYKDQPRFQCEFCGKTFVYGNSLRVHRRSHSGDYHAICDVCGKTLSSNETLKSHRRMHTGEKPFSCEVCGKMFSKREYLKMHHRVHTGERPHVCDICGKGFAQLSTLAVHKRYHTGIRPYACNFCNKAFVSRTLLKTHLKSHPN